MKKRDRLVELYFYPSIYVEESKMHSFTPRNQLLSLHLREIVGWLKC